MVLDTTVIEAEIKATVDQQSFNDGIKFARDTGVKIDQELKAQLTLDTIKAKQRIAEINKLLKTDLPEKRRLELELELGDTKRGLTEARRRLNNLANTGDAATSRLQKKFDSVNKEIRETGGIIGKVQGGFKRLGIAAASFFALDKFKDFFVGAFNLASQVQSARAAFTSLTGSLRGANDLLQEIDEFASRTPFNKLKIVDTTKQLLGFGFAADQVIPTLEGVGNAVAAVGGTDETLSGVITALGQIQAKGKLSAEEVLQIAERGIPIFDILRTELGLTEEELGNIGNAGIEAAEAIPVIVEALQTRFTGSLEAQSQTLAGQFSNLVDKTQLLVSQIGEALIPVFTFLIDVANGVIDSFRGFAEFIGLIPPSLDGVASSALGLAGSLTEVKDKIEANTLAIKKLNEEYRNGTLTTDEYNEKLQELQNTEALLTGDTESLSDAYKALNEDFIEAQEQVAANDEELKRLQGQLKLAKDGADEFGDSTGKYAEQAKNAQDEIDKLVLENRRLNEIQEILIPTQQQVQDALNSLSSAATVEEFQKIQQEGLEAIQVLQAVQQAIITSETESFGLLSPKAARAQEKLNQLTFDFIQLQGRAFKEKKEDDNKTSGGGGGKSAATIAKEKEIKEIERLEEQAIKDAEKRAKEEAKITEDVYKDAFDAIGDRIKDKEKTVDEFTKAIEKSVDKIADIDQKISELGEGTAEDLASRFVDIQSELADPEIDQSRKDALQEEANLIKANTTEEERAEAIRQEGLSDAEKILEARDLELATLEEQKTAEQEALDAATEGRDNALAQIENLRSIEKTLSDEAIAQTELEFLKKAEAAQGYADLLDSLFGSTSAAALGSVAGGQAVPTGASGGVTTVNEGDISFGDITVEGSSDPEATAQAILDLAARDIQDRLNKGS